MTGKLRLPACNKDDWLANILYETGQFSRGPLDEAARG